jgi:hypothetical protein
MAPEQIRGEAVDGRADLFALGIVLAELLTGVHPFAGEDSASTMAKILAAVPQVPAAEAAGSSESTLRAALAQIIHRCLLKTPGARFPSAHELLAALKLAGDGRPLPSAMVRLDTVRGRRWWKFHQAAASVSYTLLLWPMWLARGWVGGRPGLVLLLAAVVAVAAAIVFRAHLWFTAETLPGEWQAQRDRSLPWTRVADGLLVAVLVTAALAAPDDRFDLAALLVAAAVAVLISFTIIEPATTRVAFGRAEGSGHPSGE